MRAVSSFVAIVLLMALYAFSSSVEDTFKVDTVKSKIVWSGQNVAGGKHTGEIGISNGQLTMDGGKLTGGNFSVDINSIKVTDLTGDRATRLANHLKSEDFFEAATFPEATFAITEVSGTVNALSITGDLTAKGITKSITFPATLDQSGNTVNATATGIKIDRTDFDIKYRSGNFFTGLGDRAISDEFQLDIELVAAK